MDMIPQGKPQATSRHLGIADGWKPVSLWLTGLLLIACAVFYQTIASLISVWSGGETFTHGFFIAPISLWLIWQKREELVSLAPRPDFIALVPLFCGSLLWLLGHLASVQIVQHIAFVSVLISIIWSMIGRRAAWSIAFPLGFLFLMVPFGEEFIPPLMDLTAETTVWLVRASGIPVYQEGLYFSLPSGNWSVVEACSGVRYLISSIVLGFLFSYLTYTKLWKRALFILISCIVPIVANCGRAYMIVMIGHFSGMELATGVDHLIYGWVFFGVVMLLLFWIGGFFKDVDDDVIAESAIELRAKERQVYSPNYSVTAGLLMAVMMVGPVLAYVSAQKDPLNTDRQLEAPELTSWAQSLEDMSPWEWRPNMVNPTGQFTQHYQQDGEKVGLYVYQYVMQKQGAELVNRQNNAVAKPKLTKIVSSDNAVYHIDGNTVEVHRRVILQARRYLMIWEFNRMGRDYVGSDYLIKLKEIWAKVSGGREDGARVFVATAYDPDLPELSEKRLQAFLQEALPLLETTLDQAAGVVD